MSVVTGVVRLLSLDRRIAVVQTLDEAYSVVDVQAGRLPAIGDEVSCAVSEVGGAQARTATLASVVVVHGAGLTLAQVQERFGPLFR